MSKVITYRPDIDGLRAIAVLVVILFHAGANALPGGFVGVDVFFVISGFLITTIIHRELVQNTFTIKDFYKRRMTRILPVFYTVVAACFVVSMLLFTPSDLQDFAHSARYAVGFISNVYFHQRTGYFAPSSELMPLLHTWSLSIEEQFYIFWPLLLILGFKYLKPKSLLLASLVFTALLLAFSEWSVTNNASQAYYLLPSRAFELMLGSLLALAMATHSLPKTSNTINQILAITGLALIVLSVIFIDESHPFPGFNAFWPCLGAALIIATGHQQKTLVKDLLSNKALVFIGLLSYSLYLWHWPVIAFIKYSSLHFTSLHALLALTVTVGLSLATRKFVEQPLRSKHNLSFKRIFFNYFLVPAILVLFGYKTIKSTQGLPQRLSGESLQVIETIRSKFNSGPLSDNILYDQYTFGDSSQKITSLLWGDSHARQFQAFLNITGKEQGVHSASISSGNCQPLLGTYRLKHGNAPRPNCIKLNDDLLAALNENSDITTVYIAARWSMYMETTVLEGEKKSREFIGDDSNIEESIANSQRTFRDGLIRTIEFLIHKGKRVVLFEQIPSYNFDPANCMIKRAQYPGLFTDTCSISAAFVDNRQRSYLKVFSEMTARYPELEVISLSHFLCASTRCNSDYNNLPLYMDNDHLNAQGAELLAKQYLEQTNGK